MRIVIDMNVFVSRLLLPESVPGRAARRAIDSGTVLVSEDTLKGLADVLARPKLDTYVSLIARQQFFQELGQIADFVPIVQRIRAEMQTNARVVATGGLADVIAEQTPVVDAIEPHLSLVGLRLFHERAQASRPGARS